MKGHVNDLLGLLQLHLTASAFEEQAVCGDLRIGNHEDGLCVPTQQREDVDEDWQVDLLPPTVLPDQSHKKNKETRTET